MLASCALLTAALNCSIIPVLINIESKFGGKGVVVAVANHFLVEILDYRPPPWRVLVLPVNCADC